MKICGIYKIENKINGKIYIGESIDIKIRWCVHIFDLKNNKHQNLHLQLSWNKYKKNTFEFSILKECQKEELKYWEEYYINFYQSYDREKGYNVERISNGIKIVSEETKQKMSNTRKGNCCGEKNSFYSMHHSEESKNKISKANKGKSGTNNGKIFSIETRRKMSESKRGTKHSEETKRKMIKTRIENEIFKGENNPNSKLTWEQVKEIREKYIPFIYCYGELAKKYNVSVSTISSIIKNKIWIENNE